MLKTTTLRFQSMPRLVFYVIIAAFIGLFMTYVEYHWQGMLLVLVVIGILSIFLLPRLAQAEGGGIMIKILVAGLLLKLCFSMINYWFAFIIYEGTADANYYSNWGTLISQYMWDLEFDKVTPFMNWGTDFICLFTGVVYSVIGPSIYGGFLVYAYLSFLGSYYFYRAFRIAFPDENKRLFLLLIFFFPAILYWPSAIGKDALMFLCLGLFAYGCARLTQNERRGLIPLAIGFTGALWIRPHIAAISILAFALAFFLPGIRKQHLRPAAYIIGLLAVVGLIWFTFPKIMAFLNIRELSPSEMIAFIQQYQGFSYEGGSAFQASNPDNPLTFLMTPITILFRPFPWEAHNIQAFVESLTGILVLGLTLWRIKSLGRAIASSITNIYPRYILFYFIAFVIIFAAIVNFGTLARERVMLYPFFFMLLSFGSSSLARQREASTKSIGAQHE